MILEWMLQSGALPLSPIIPMKLTLSTLLAAVALLPAAAPAQTDLGPLNLPAMSSPLPLSENFEAGAGTIPPYMALTNLDVATLLPDAEAWCNVGQLAPCTIPFDGAFNLEMGLIPGSTNYHDVRNAMVLGLDASAYSGNMDMSFMGINLGEEFDTVDGVWVSDDGANWYQIWGPWSTFASNVWTHSGILPLDGTPANTSGVFYLAFVQEDNFPYDNLDGAGVDSIKIPGVPAPPEMSVDQMTAGAYTTVTVDSDSPNRPCKILASRNGGGPTTVFGIDLDLSLPIIELAEVPTDINGLAAFTTIVHPAMSGSQIWLQAVVLDVGAAYVSNGHTQTIL